MKTWRRASWGCGHSWATCFFGGLPALLVPGLPCLVTTHAVCSFPDLLEGSLDPTLVSRHLASCIIIWHWIMCSQANPAIIPGLWDHSLFLRNIYEKNHMALQLFLRHIFLLKCGMNLLSNERAVSHYSHEIYSALAFLGHSDAPQRRFWPLRAYLIYISHCKTVSKELLPAKISFDPCNYSEAKKAQQDYMYVPKFMGRLRTTVRIWT